MKKLILILLLLVPITAFAQFSSGGGSSGGGTATDVTSGTTTVTGGTNHGLLSNEGGILTADDGCTLNVSTNTLTCTTFVGALTGNASTATALAANGTNCSGNNFALGVDASGNGECAQPAFSNLSGTATDAQIPDNITVSLAATATALAADPADCSAGQVATGIAASGALSCTATPTVTTLTGNVTGTASIAATGDSATSFFSTGILESTIGGTANGFTKFSGPASSEKTFTLPNASAAILTDNAAVTVAQGGTGTGTWGDDKVAVGDSNSAVTMRSLPTVPQNGPTVTQALVYNSSTNSFTGVEEQPTPVLSGRHGGWWYTDVAGTTFTGVGMAGSGTAGTSSIYAADETTFNKHYVTCTTKSASPTSGDECGLVEASFNKNRFAWLPKFTATMAMDATISSERVWVGIASADLNGTSTNTTAAAIRFIAAGYDTGIPDTNWRIVNCVGTGGANTCTSTDSTIAVTASHEYRFVIDVTNASNSFYWRVYDLTASTSAGGQVTSNLPTSTNNFGTIFDVTTLTSAQRLIWVNGVYLERQ